MIRLGLRLALRSGREATVRLVVTALAVSLGVAMLLITLAGINGVNSQNARWAWLDTAATPARASAVDPAWWRLTADTFHGDVIGRVDVAATGPTSPVPPGVPRLPRPGEMYVSPALASLLQRTPAAQLADRYPAHVVGIIGHRALPAPDTLVALVGRTPADVARLEGAERVTRIATTPPSSCSGPQCLAIGIDSNGIDLVLAVTAVALLFPVFIFIGTAARLSAARREERLAAMRLVGATPRQVAQVAVVESACAAVLGVAVGFALFFLLRAPLAQVPFTGSRFFETDLSLTTWDVLPVVLGIPVAAALAATVALRRVAISPLGVSRRATPTPPTAWRLLPLALGLAELAYFVQHGRPRTTPGQIQAFTSGIVVTMVGLVTAGPWLAMVGARLMSRRAQRPSSLLAARRMSDNPKAAFRSISGLVLALFVASIAIGMITTIDHYDGTQQGQPYASRLLVEDLTDYRPFPYGPTGSALPAGFAQRVVAAPGVTGLLVMHQDPAQTQYDGLGLVDCGQLARFPSIGRCAAGATTASMPTQLDTFRGYVAPSSRSVWPATSYAPEQLAHLPVLDVVVGTDGSTAAVERARTAIESTLTLRSLPQTVQETGAGHDNAKLDAAYRQLVEVVVLCSLVLAGASLAVSVVTGLNDRKRPFSLLRLSGAPLSVLRRVVLLESALPLLVVAVASAGVGFLSAYLFLRAQLHENLQWPPLAYYVTVAAGLVVALTVTASTLPMLTRITGPETARNE